MQTKTAEVNTFRVPSRLEPRSAFAARILIITLQWLVGAITTAANAAAIADCSPPTIDAARILLQSGDDALMAQVLSGRISLTAAAARLRRRVRLIRSFQQASADDRRAFGHAIGPAAIFDDAVVGAL